MLMIGSSCRFLAYSVDSKSPATSNTSESETKVITMDSIPISEYWFRKIFLGHEQMRCYDDPVWTDSHGEGCISYVSKSYCHDGGYGPKWNFNWGTFAEFAVDGVDASQACCACGRSPQEFNKSTILARFESACACASDLCVLCVVGLFCQYSRSLLSDLCVLCIVGLFCLYSRSLLSDLCVRARRDE